MTTSSEGSGPVGRDGAAVIVGRLLAVLAPLSTEPALAASGYPLPTPLDFRPILATPGRDVVVPGNSKVSVTTSINCNRSTPEVGCEVGASRDTTDATPFTIEIVNTPNGFWYHQIIGDASSDYQDEMYIRAGGGHLGGDFPVTDATGRYIGYECMTTCGSYSGGLHSSPSVTHATVADLPRIGGNGIDPLNIDPMLTGNGSGNPNHVLFRQRVGGADIDQEFIKDRWSYKPVLTQALSFAGGRQDTRIDMGNSTYDRMDVAGRLTITSSFDDPFLDGVARFDSVVDAPQAAVSAGRYVYTPKTVRGYWYLEANGVTIGSPNDPNACGDPAFRDRLRRTFYTDPAVGGLQCVWVTVGSVSGHDGGYTYANGGGVDPVHQRIDWMAFRDPVQNPFPASKMDAASCPPVTDPAIASYPWCPQP